MKEVDSDALGIVTKALGLTGPGAQITELEDGQLQQVVDVAPMIRRGRTIAAGAGIFRVQLQNIHAGAGDESSSFAPYAAGTGVIPPWPDPVPRGFDVWLFGAGVILSAGTPALEDCGLFVGTIPQAFGITSAGAPLVLGANACITWWNSNVEIGGAEVMRNTVSGSVWQELNMRVPPLGEFGVGGNQVTVSFLSTTDAAATLDCILHVGLFPVSLGQDAAF